MAKVDTDQRKKGQTPRTESAEKSAQYPSTLIDPNFKRPHETQNKSPKQLA
jgi:hypothetical protein